MKNVHYLINDGHIEDNMNKCNEKSHNNMKNNLRAIRIYKKN